MIKGANKKIDSTQLLKTYDQEAVFRLVGFNPDLKRKNHRNPLRSDKKGGCWYTWYNGILYFNDHSPSFAYDSITCIQAVQMSKGFKTYDQTCAFIMNQLKPSGNVGTVNQMAKKEIHPITIRVNVQDWTDDNNFYAEYGVSKEELLKERVYLVKDYWCNSRYAPGLIKNPLFDPTQETVICYIFKSGKKQLYFPNDNGFLRFYNSATQADLFGQDIIDNEIQEDVLFWTCGGKDYLTTRYGLGLTCMGNISENYNMSFSTLHILRKRFKKIIAIGDNDAAGKKALKKKEDLYGMTPLVMHELGCKDISDVFKKIGKEKTLCYLKKFL